MAAYAIAVEKSQNRKMGEASATYASQHSCPNDCPFRNAGCYAEARPVGYTTARLNRASALARPSPERIARAEAREIAKLSGERPLRVHVVGDCKTDASARIIARAMIAHTAKRGESAWTTTHAWRTVERASWYGANVLASCESADDVKQAQARGYATCIVVDFHDSNSRYARDNIAIVPCPAQTQNKTCVDCGLCALWSVEIGASIGFAAHGMQAKVVRSKLECKS